MQRVSSTRWLVSFNCFCQTGNNPTYAASQGRLNHHTTYIAAANNKGQWIQVDFGKVAKVTKIGTQGRYNVGQWVTKYMVSYSIDGGYFQFQLLKHYDEPRVRANSCVTKI